MVIPDESRNFTLDLDDQLSPSTLEVLANFSTTTQVTFFTRPAHLINRSKTSRTNCLPAKCERPGDARDPGELLFLKKASPSDVCR